MRPAHGDIAFDVPAPAFAHAARTLRYLTCALPKYYHRMLILALVARQRRTVSSPAIAVSMRCLLLMQRAHFSACRQRLEHEHIRKQSDMLHIAIMIAQERSAISAARDVTIITQV
jgi:hypothetical protein